MKTKFQISRSICIFIATLPFLFFNQTLASQEKSISISGIPYPLEWINVPTAFIQKTDTIAITAGPNTNMFISHWSNFNVCNMPMLVFEPDTNFSLTVKATANHQSRWDAAMLAVYVNEKYWAKLCFEMPQPNLKRMVSVVNNTFSDDAYGDVIMGNDVFMRVSREGERITFSYSTDGTNWVDLRYFALQEMDGIKIGFASQSPTGIGFTSKFSQITYKTSNK